MVHPNEAVQAAFDRRHVQFRDNPPITSEHDEEREAIIADAPFGE